MTAELTNRLNRLKNRSTGYEMALEGPNGERYLICYLHGPSHSHAIRALTKPVDAETQQTRLDWISKIAGADTETWRTPTKRTTVWECIAESNNGWKVRLTHRTQREAYIAGELPYARTAAQA